MSSISSVKSGDWSDPTVWSGGVVPGSGDDVVITAPNVVTVDVASSANTVSATPTWGGSQPASIHAQIVINYPLNLAATSGVAFTYSSYEIAPALMVTLGPGASITVNPASGQTVTMQLGNSNGNASVLHANGTGWGAGQFCEFKNAGAGTFTMASTNESAQLVGSYVKFTGVNGGIQTFLNQASNPGFLLDHAIFSGCGKPALNVGPDVPFRFHDVRFEGSVDATYSAQLGVNVPSSGIERTHDLVVYDKALSLNGSGISFSRTLFMAGISSGAAVTWSGFDGCLLRKSGLEEVTTCDGPVTNSYILWDRPGMDNPHFLALSTGLDIGVVPEWVVTGNIFDGPAVAPSTDQGDIIAGPPTDRPLILTGNLALPIASGAYAGLACGDFIAAGGGSGTLITAEHNTLYGRLTGYPAFYYGESYGGIAGMYASVRSNLIFDPDATSPTTHLFGPVNGTITFTDAASSADVSNNGGLNLATGASGYGYTAPFSSGSPGAGDVHADPGFVDPTRNFPTWAVSQGSTGATLADQIADGLSYVAADPSLIADLVGWVRDGFAPTNAAFHNAAHDGTDIGAIAYFAAALPACVGDDCSFLGYFEA